MKYSIKLIIFSLFLVLFCACPQESGNSGDGGKSGTSTPRYTLSFTVFDAGTKRLLDNSSIQIIETGIETAIGSSSKKVTVTGGEYNFLIAKEGYSPRCLALNVAANENVKVYLKKKYQPVLSRASISGSFMVDGAPYTMPFSISAGNSTYTHIETPFINDRGQFSSTTAQAGPITVSAFTMTESKALDKVTYKKDNIFPASGKLTDIALDYTTSTALDYSGTIAGAGELQLKLSGTFSLGEQEAGLNAYDFTLNKESSDDIITLDAVEYNGSNTDFSRTILLEDDRKYDFVKVLQAPDFTISKEDTYYRLTFTADPGASYYTAYVLEVTNKLVSIPFEAKFMGTTDLKIPAGLINSNADMLMIYFSAVKVDNFVESDFYNGLSLDASFSYREAGKAFPVLNNSNTLRSTGMSRVQNADSFNYRKEYRLDTYLISH